MSLSAPVAWAESLPFAKTSKIIFRGRRTKGLRVFRTVQKSLLGLSSISRLQKPCFFFTLYVSGFNLLALWTPKLVPSGNRFKVEIHLLSAISA